MASQEQPVVRPDEVIGPADRRGERRRALAEAALLIPNMVKLVARLLADDRVPRGAKVTLGMAAAYAAVPIDLIPDIVPVLGWVDDLIIMTFAIDTLVKRAGPEIVAEHWDGPVDILNLITEVIGLTRSLIPRRITAIVDRFSG